MLISKFNKLIRNRLIWGIIAGVVGLSMVVYLGSLSILDYIAAETGCSHKKAVSTDTVALLDEKPISETEFRQALDDTYLSLCFMVGQKIERTEPVEKEIRRRTWERIAALRQAAALSIETSDEEVLAAITRDEKFFAENGQFQSGRYQAFAQSVLPQFGATLSDYERMVRDDVTLQKLQNTIGASAWVAPYELDQAMATYADTFTVKSVTLPESLVADSVKPDRAELKAYFEAHTNLFEVPAKVKVRYVAFNTPAIAAFTQAVTEEDIEQYYDYNRKAYRMESTNQTETLADESESIENLRPLDDVRDEIRLQLAGDLAREDALARARDFSYALTPDRNGYAQTFDALASNSQWNVPIHTTDWFSLHETIPGIPDSLSFRYAAFELEPDSEDAYSDGISESNAAYVIHLLARQDPRVPSFDEVENQVRPMALKELRRQALLSKAESIRQDFLAGLKAGKSFDSLATQQKLAVTNSSPFSTFTAPDELSDLKTLNEITSRFAGDITDPIVTTNGLILVYVAQRVPALDETKQAVFRQVLTSLARQRSRMVYSEWERSLTTTNHLRLFNQKDDESIVAPEPDTEQEIPTHGVL